MGLVLPLLTPRHPSDDTSKVKKERKRGKIQCLLHTYWNRARYSDANGVEGPQGSFIQLYERGSTRIRSSKHRSVRLCQLIGSVYPVTDRDITPSDEIPTFPNILHSGIGICQGDENCVIPSKAGFIHSRLRIPIERH